MIERHERFCQFCKNIVEYAPARGIFENVCISNCPRYETLNTDQKFIFILLNENPEIIKHLGKFVVESMTLREKLMEYFFT